VSAGVNSLGGVVVLVACFLYLMGGDILLVRCCVLFSGYFAPSVLTLEIRGMFGKHHTRNVLGRSQRMVLEGEFNIQRRRSSPEIMAERPVHSSPLS